MSLLDNIKAKTTKILMKTDEFLRNNGINTGMGVATASAITGIGGISAIVGGTTLPFIASIAAAPIMIMGVPVIAAGALLLGGGVAGMGFAGLAKLYKEARGGEVRKYTWGPQFLDCVDHNGKTQHLKAMDVFKEIELGTFKDKYQSLLITDPKTKEKSAYKSDGLTLEDANFYALAVEGRTSNSTLIENVEIVRRNIIKESNNSSIITKVAESLAKFDELSWVKNTKANRM